jgi:outer membrane biosynthesis protein TonB
MAVGICFGIFSKIPCRVLNLQMMMMKKKKKKMVKKRKEKKKKMVKKRKKKSVKKSVEEENHRKQILKCLMLFSLHENICRKKEEAHELLIC